MKTKLLIAAATSLSMAAVAQEKPNIVVLLADDISAREFPIYESDTWSPPEGGDTQDQAFRAKTPVMEQLARKGVVISTCWSCTVSMPTRGQLMTGRYGHLTKWWHNGDQGRYLNAEGQQETWPLYESSPMMIGKVAQQGGYATCWSGKTQMAHTDTNIDDYGFDEGLYTPGDLSNSSPLTDFTMRNAGKRRYIVEDSGAECNTYLQTSYFWYPSVMVVNSDDNTERNKMQPWPVKAEDKENFGLNSFSADIEQDFIFDFMERKHDEGKPFFIYHTAHLGHDQYNFLNPTSTAHWVATPKVDWNGKSYTRTEPNITGDKGVYDAHGTITDEGMHSQVSYLDYVIWRYMEKFREMGIEKNTVFIITSDNGTSKYGKGSHVGQRGTHVPFIIYAPCLKMSKKGHEKALMNIADILPTVADIAGVEIPADYELSGESLIPFLTTKSPVHRDWIYSYKSNFQMVRGDEVMRDGAGTWYDVSATPSDLGSFPKIKDWSKATEAQQAEKAELEGVLERLDLHESAHDGPGGIFVMSEKMKGTMNKK